MSYEGPLIKLFKLITGHGDALDTIVSFFAILVILLLVFPVHECAHGLMAKFLGDDTAERQGRLTLNPLSHLDPMGAFFMLFFPIGWARPVEVNYSRCRKVKGKTAMALTAAAGPLANICMAYLVLVVEKVVLYNLNIDLTMGSYIVSAFSYIIMISLYLAVLNLLPIPPFDGSKILFAFLHPRTVMRIMSRQQIISLVFLLLLFTTNIFTMIIGSISNFIYSGLNFLSGYIDLIFR